MCYFQIAIVIVCYYFSGSIMWETHASPYKVWGNYFQMIGRSQSMNTKNGWNVALVIAGIVSVFAAGFITIGFAEEKKTIPDHAGFQSCQPCHAEKQSMWEASGHGKAIRQIANSIPAATDCSGCHSSKKPETGQQGIATDSDKKDGFHKVSCLACHSRQKSEFDHRLVMDPEKLCDLCHIQRSVFWGKGAKGIEDSRNFHSGVPCISCHMSEGNHKMKVIRPDDPGLTEKRQDTCTACHMDNNREARVRQIKEWQSTYDENMTPLLADVKTIEAALKKTPGLLNTALKLKFDDVKANLAILEKDGSRSFHNFVFSLEITSLAATDLKEIKAVIK
jgi:predicted CXXCH cytochrome family protein